MWYERLLEKSLLPDVLLRAGIRRLLTQRLREETRRANLPEFVRQLKASPIAINTADANQQHYEVPPEFFVKSLGPRLKYSSCYYPDGVTDLPAAEEAMLDLTCRRAQIAGGQDVLELGCGWGSLGLYIAEKFPSTRVTGVSNSRTQKQFIDARARERGLENVNTITCDINDFEAGRTFDRIVSVEMFEHVRNYEKLLARVAAWMKPEARLFVHIFCHARFAYPFEATGDHDWMARYFFTGGIMPSADLLHHFQDDVRLLDQWAVNGQHYEKTLDAWLSLMDSHRAEIFPLFEQTYGKRDALKWWSYWRIFYMSCAELFGYRGGDEWFVAHYLFARR